MVTSGNQAPDQLSPYGVLWQPRTRSAKYLLCSLATKDQISLVLNVFSGNQGPDQLSPYGVLWQPSTKSAKSLLCTLATKDQIS